MFWVFVRRTTITLITLLMHGHDKSRRLTSVKKPVVQYRLSPMLTTQIPVLSELHRLAVTTEMITMLHCYKYFKRPLRFPLV